MLKPLKATISVFFTAALLAAMSRITARICYQKRIFIDDYVLLFGCVAMTASFILVNTFLEDLYWGMFLELGPMEQVILESETAGFDDRILHYQQMSFANAVLTVLTIFAVKVSYLIFFRQMLYRLQAQMMYWKAVTIIVIVAGLFCICNMFISCPHFGVSASKHLDMKRVMSLT